MKICIIYGSPRKGNTWRSIQVIREEMAKQGTVEFTEFFLPKDLPQFCRGCYQCFMKGEDKCPDASYVQPIVEEMLKSDGFIMGSPVYALQLSGMLKSFLDHTSYCYVNHRPRFFRQKALVVATTAGAGIRDCLKYIKKNLQFWGVNKVHTYGCSLLSLDFEGMKEEKRLQMLAQLKKTAKSYYQDVQSGKMHAPTLIQTVFFNASKYLMTLNPDDSLDRIHWEKAGWTLKKAHYFASDIRPGPFKQALGSLAYFMFSRMVKS